MMGNSNIAIISFDPGKTTGVCLAEGVNYAERSFEITLSDQILWNERRNIYSGLYQLRQWEEQGRLYLARIVIEDFRLYEDKAQEQIGSDFPSCKIIERIITCAELLGFEDRITMQQPGQRLNVKILEEHKPKLSSSLHAQDAYKHLRYFVLMNRPRSGARLAGKGRG